MSEGERNRPPESNKGLTFKEILDVVQLKVELALSKQPGDPEKRKREIEFLLSGITKRCTIIEHLSPDQAEYLAVDLALLWKTEFSDPSQGLDYLQTMKRVKKQRDTATWLNTLRTASLDLNTESTLTEALASGPSHHFDWLRKNLGSNKNDKIDALTTRSITMLTARCRQEQIRLNNDQITALWTDLSMAVYNRLTASKEDELEKEIQWQEELLAIAIWLNTSIPITIEEKELPAPPPYRKPPVLN